MSDSDFKWVNLLAECLRRLRDSDEAPVSFVDWEIMAPFDGAPTGIFVWFICATAALKERFREEGLHRATQRLREMAVESGFPSSAAETLRSDVTSVEDIDAGGGRFYFFR